MVLRRLEVLSGFLSCKVPHCVINKGLFLVLQIKSRNTTVVGELFAWCACKI